VEWFDGEIYAEGGWLPEFDKPKYRDEKPHSMGGGPT